MVRWWRDVRSTHSGIIAAYKCADQIIEPIRICHAVRIGVGEHFPFGGSGPTIASVTQSMIALLNVAHPWELRCNVGRGIRSTVIDQNDFILRVVELT